MVFYVTSSPPRWWTVNKRLLISSFCLSTSICSFHHCYLCLPRLHENHLFVRPKTSWTRQLDRRQPYNYFTHREEIVCMLPHKQRFLLIPRACLWRSLFRLDGLYPPRTTAYGFFLYKLAAFRAARKLSEQLRGLGEKARNRPI